MNQTLQDGLDVTAQQRESAQQLPAPSSASESTPSSAPALLPMTTDDLSDGIESLLSGCVRNEITRLTLTQQILGLFAEYIERTRLLGGGAEARAEARR